MTMDSTMERTSTTGDGVGYPLDPLSGAEIEAAARVVTESEYATPTLKFVMIQLAEPEKTPELQKYYPTDVLAGWIAAYVPAATP